MSNTEQLRTFQKKDIEWLHTWFEDAEVKRRLERMMPFDDWFRFADENENYRVWAALKEGKPVGVVMVEIEEDLTGNIALLVDPLLRGRGYGKALI
ncbi:GNAT family N-acetyltransferase [Pusillimonas sp. ANT_WB101]|uniref:GNAT family N-acetyltransferase n=1 Tax=Pusillimonas sp. ANT_WB101 TaxID=2597356 RepID=UPI001CAA88EB|nr:GNAT family N-acetyltransferase [Pusillimonas sp. ANT_WB101]